jgi:hypothetical protein
MSLLIFAVIAAVNTIVFLLFEWLRQETTNDDRFSPPKILLMLCSTFYSAYFILSFLQVDNIALMTLMNLTAFSFMLYAYLISVQFTDKISNAVLALTSLLAFTATVIASMVLRILPAFITASVLLLIVLIEHFCIHLLQKVNGNNPQMQVISKYMLMEFVLIFMTLVQIIVAGTLHAETYILPVVYIITNSVIMLGFAMFANLFVYRKNFFSTTISDLTSNYAESLLTSEQSGVIKYNSPVGSSA